MPYGLYRTSVPVQGGTLPLPYKISSRMTFFRHNFIVILSRVLKYVENRTLQSNNIFCNILSTGIFLSHIYSFMSFWYVKVNNYSPPKSLYLRPVSILQSICYSLHSAPDISRSGWATWNTRVSLLSVYTEIVETWKNEMFLGLRQNPDSYKNVKGNITYSVTTSHLYGKRINMRMFYLF